MGPLTDTVVNFVCDRAAIDHLAHSAGRRLAVQRRGPEWDVSLVVACTNRRLNPRVNLSESSAVVRVEAAAVSGLDLSLHGLQFWTLQRVSPGNVVTIAIEGPDGVVSMALARVVWATFERPNSAAPPGYRAGASFESWDLPTMRTILDQCGLGQVSDIEVVHLRW